MTIFAQTRWHQHEIGSNCHVQPKWLPETINELINVRNCQKWFRFNKMPSISNHCSQNTDLCVEMAQTVAAQNMETDIFFGKIIHFCLHRNWRDTERLQQFELCINWPDDGRAVAWKFNPHSIYCVFICFRSLLCSNLDFHCSFYCSITTIQNIRTRSQSAGRTISRDMHTVCELVESCSRFGVHGLGHMAQGRDA